jgi:hypothetical protein
MDDSTEAPPCDACRRIPISHLARDVSEPLVGWEAFFDCPRCRRKAWAKKPPANAYALRRRLGGASSAGARARRLPMSAALRRHLRRQSLPGRSHRPTRGRRRQ